MGFRVGGEQGEVVFFLGGGEGMGSQLAAVLALPLAVDTQVWEEAAA